MRITHNDGVARIEISQLPEEIRKELNYDPTAATAALRDEHQKRIAAAAATSEATVRAPVAPIPGTLQMLIAKGNESVARTEFEKYLRTAPRVEARGTVLRHLDSGHVLATGSIGDPKTRGISYQTFLLFGLPEADRLADGDTFDAFAVYGDAIEIAGGSRTREVIYVDEGGRRPNRFPRNSGIYGN